MKLIQNLLVIFFCAMPIFVAAQWQWIDKDGRKVFSDRPPAADVPEKNILKQPNPRPKTNEMSTSPVAPTLPSPGVGAQGSKPAPKPGEGVDKGLMEKKKQAETAEAAKRKADEDRIASAKAENCARSRQAKAGLDAGTRMSRVNEKGEREFLDDSARASESQRIQSVIDSDCR